MATASWVVVEIATGKPVLETFNRKLADAINRDKYRVVPILEWLQSLNSPEAHKPTATSAHGNFYAVAA